MEIHGYKGFNGDMTCRCYQYKVGKTFHHDGEVEVGKSGFHFCEKLHDVFTHYPYFCCSKTCTLYCKVVGSGTIMRRGDAVAASTLRVVEKLNGTYPVSLYMYTFRDGEVIDIQLAYWQNLEYWQNKLEEWKSTMKWVVGVGLLAIAAVYRF
jgi:hypothetical protein